MVQARAARLSTVRPDGHPHIVVINFALDGATIVTAIDHNPKTTTALQRLKNIEAHPVVSILIDHYEDDWSRAWWVRADGTAKIESEGAPRAQAIELLADNYAPYRQRPPCGPVIAVTVDRSASWSA